MRVRVIEIEGTPQELAESRQLWDLLTGHGSALPGTGAREDGAELRLPDEVTQLLHSRAPAGPLKEAVETFLLEVASWGGVDLRVGTSRTPSRQPTVIRAHRRGTGVGAFVYVTLGGGANLKFRLPTSEDLSGCTFAWTRKVQRDAPYGIALRLSAQSLPEALRLAQRAYAATVRQ